MDGRDCDRIFAGMISPAFSSFSFPDFACANAPLGELRVSLLVFILGAADTAESGTTLLRCGASAVIGVPMATAEPRVGDDCPVEGTACWLDRVVDADGRLL
jgi:hypothetical protein